MPVTGSVPVQGAATLLDLMGGDEARMLRILHAFLSTTSNDLLQLDDAVRQGNCKLVKQTANRLSMACYLVGERDAGMQLDAIVRAGSSVAIDPIMTQCIERARIELIDSIVRISMRIEPDDGSDDRL